jgi:DeoR family ulaG and ulaABCDEF operon transcriptional repressor
MESPAPIGFCSTSHGLMHSTCSSAVAFMEEKKMHAYADKIIALVDADKIGVFGGITLFNLDELDIVITGKTADPAIIERLNRKNIKVFLV